MPLYEYLCPVGHRTEEYRPAARSSEGRICECGARAERVLSAPRVLADYPGYHSPITGEWIEGRKAHREDLARHNCRLKEPGETEEAQRRMRQESEAYIARVDEVVERTAGELGIQS